MHVKPVMGYYGTQILTISVQLVWLIVWKTTRPLLHPPGPLLTMHFMAA